MIFWEFAKGREEALAKAFLENPAPLLKESGEILKTSGFHRLIWRYENFLVKEFVFSSFFERLKWKNKISAPQKEWRALTELEAEGVSVPPPIALGYKKEGKQIFVWLISEFVENCVTYDELRPDYNQEKTEKLARLIAGLHAAFFVHRDLHAGNLLWQENTARWFITDFQHASRGFATRVQLVGDLVQLQHCLGKKVPLRLRIIFLREYIRAFAEFTGTLETHSRTDWHSVFTEVSERVLAYDISQAGARSRRALKKNRDFEPYAKGFRARGESLQLADDLIALFKRPGWADSTNVSRVRRGLRSVSAVYDHPHGKTSVFCVEGHLRFWEKFLPFLRRDLRLWKAAARLTSLHVSCERPVLIQREEDYYFYASLSKAAFTFREAFVMHDASKRREDLRLLARLIGRMHSCGVVHNNLSGENVWFSEAGQLYLRRLEKVKFYREIPWFGRVRDLSDLLASAGGNLSYADLRFFLRHYLKALPERVDLRLLINDTIYRASLLEEQK